MEKQFAIVTLPKECDYIGCSWLDDPEYFDDYGKAFDDFNCRIGSEGKQIFKMPKGEKPLRVALEDKDIELWVITRTEELTTTD